MPLLKKHPGNVELMQLGAMMYLEDGDLEEAREVIERLEAATGDTTSLKEMKGALLSREGKGEEALEIFRALMKEYPDNWNYRREYAELYRRLGLWSEAKDAYYSVLENDSRRHEIIWDYKQILQEGSSVVDTNFEYIHAPESLREYTIEERVSLWAHRRVRVSASLYEEIYKKPPLGDADKILELIPGHMLKTDWILNGMVMLSGYWEVSYLDSHDFHETGISMHYEGEGFNSETGYRNNHLIRSPVESFKKKGRSDMFYTANEINQYYPFIFGNLFDLTWYRVRPETNQINGEESLGHRLVCDVFANVVILEKPYLSFNFHYKHAYWDEPFDRAQEVLDFIEAEEVYYGGFYFEHNIGEIMKFSGSITRTYDHKRDFYSTLSLASIEFWLRDNVQLLFSYEYDYNASGTLGQGDVQVMQTRARVLF